MHKDCMSIERNQKGFIAKQNSRKIGQNTIIHMKCILIFHFDFFCSGFDCHESIVKHKLVSDCTQRISIVLLMASHKISNNSIFWDWNLEYDVYLFFNNSHIFVNLLLIIQVTKIVYKKIKTWNWNNVPR